MVSSEHLTLPGDNATANLSLRPRSGTNPSSQQGNYASSGISSHDSAPVPGPDRTNTNESNAPMAAAAPSCLRQEMTSMTLIGLLLRGMDGDDAPPRTTVPPAGGMGWARLAPEFPQLDTPGAGRLRPNRRMQQVLGEAMQIIASDIPADGGASSSRGVYAPQ